MQRTDAGSRLREGYSEPQAGLRGVPGREVGNEGVWQGFALFHSKGYLKV